MSKTVRSVYVRKHFRNILLCSYKVVDATKDIGYSEKTEDTIYHITNVPERVTSGTVAQKVINISSNLGDRLIPYAYLVKIPKTRHNKFDIDLDNRTITRLSDDVIFKIKLKFFEQ